MHAFGGRTRPILRAAAMLAASVLFALAAAYYLTYEPAPEIRVRWRDGVTAERRAELERRFRLVNPSPFEDRLAYDLLDMSHGNIEALVREPDVQDTDRVDRVGFTLPVDYRYGSSWMWIAHRLPVLRIPGVVEVIVLTCALVLAVGARAEVVARRMRRT